MWIVLGIVLLLVGGAVGSYLGYSSAIARRMQTYDSQVAQNAATQFQLGLQDFDAKRYENARRRFEYVIQLDPKFPGAADKLTEVMLAAATVATPTLQPSPTPSPTPDNRGVEELFNQAGQYARAGQWDAVIQALDLLRKSDITYRAVEADGLYYMALRNRGVEKILGGHLEEGMYDLALSERFAPLDKDADGFRTWARLYVTGASFWGVDWPKVIDIFGQIYPSLPNLHDGSGWTAQERYRVALIRYGDALVLKGEYCSAQKQYEAALAISNDSAVARTATEVAATCSPATKTPKPKPTEITLPTEEAPTVPPEPTQETALPPEPTADTTPAAP